jgi:hypothetical protein
VSVNVQLNRWLSWMTPQAVTDVAAIAPRIHGYADFTSAFLELGERLLAAGRRLDAAFCYRAAEFVLVPGDERKAPARQRFLELVRDVYQIGPERMATCQTKEATCLHIASAPLAGEPWSGSEASTATARSSSP